MFPLRGLKALSISFYLPRLSRIYSTTLSENFTASTLHNSATFIMCNEHYKKFAECKHRELIQTWSAWINTRIWRANQVVTVVDGLCHDCIIYEEAKAKILTAREVAKAEGRVDENLIPSWEQNRSPGTFKLRKSRRRNW